MHTLPFHIIDHCPERSWVKGERVMVGDPGYPAMTWGSYLPGDEPHWECAIDGGYCDEDIDAYDCPRFELIEEECPLCGYSETFTDTVKGEGFCYQCLEHFKQEESA